MRSRPLGVLLVPLLLAGTLAHGQALEATAPQYLCYDVRPPRAAGRDRADMAVTDRFASRQVSLLKPQALCQEEAPGVRALEGIGVELARTQPRQRRRLKQGVDLVTRFGRQSVKVRTLDGLLIPATAVANPDGVEPPSGSDPSYTCYTVRRGTRPKGDRPRLPIADAFGERVYDVRRPTRLCVQADPNGRAVLLCHTVKLARTGQARFGRLLTFATSTLGTDLLRVLGPSEVCVPGLEVTTPTPGLTLELSPLAVGAVGREHVAFTATAHLPTGGTEDWTTRVVWTSSNAEVARIGDSSAGGAFVETIGPGMTVISATDPSTGVSSADQNGNAALTVAWPLEKLLLSPHAATKLVGDDEDYTVTGVFSGGITRNLTPRVTYASSDGFVASFPDAVRRPSRVHADRVGTATISATDPVSGISTTNSANDATLRVAPEFQAIAIKADADRNMFPGQSRRLTAVGYYADTSTRNFTQRCTWLSSNPSVATAMNPDGDRSRIDGLAVGMTEISCRDERTGMTSPPLPVWVLGDIAVILVDGGGGPDDQLNAGEFAHTTAVGRYAGGGTRNITQEVTWASRDPEIVIATNQDGDKSRFIAVGPGRGRIYATDPVSGIVSSDHVLTVLRALLGVEFPPISHPPIVIGVGGVHQFFPLWGHYEGGVVRHVSSRSYVIESSDPTIAVVDRLRLVGRAPGTVQVRARHRSGLVSPPVIVQVRGNLERIAIDPPTATRGIGEWETFTITGFTAPDITENLTQFVQYTSSDPSVAVADNAFRDRSRVRTVGPGTATITATALPSGPSATATITVLPGTLESITIEPPVVQRNIDNGFSFTAIGHYPDGTTLNVTQVVTWASLLPDVAEATNRPGNRSRVVAKSEGDAPIVALHPSGVSSHDTGADALFQVRPLTGLRLIPEGIARRVGDVERYTFVGTFADATTINLTQDAYYWTDDPTVAFPNNAAGDRSAVFMAKVGTTGVHAIFADWFQDDSPVTSGSTAGAFLSVLP